MTSNNESQIEKLRKSTKNSADFVLRRFLFILQIYQAHRPAQYQCRVWKAYRH